MDSEITHLLLESRLSGINEAQKRARIALFFSTLAAGTIIAALWNAYFSWDRQWASIAKEPTSWGQQQLLAHQIEEWMQSNTVDISLLGIRVSASDAAVLGSVVLLIFSFYHCMTKRRENHEIGSLLVETKTEEPRLRKFVFSRIQSFMVFTAISDDDSPYVTLDENRKPESKRLLGQFWFGLLTYFPVLTITFILFTDIYFSFFYISPWRGNSTSAWATLSLIYQRQLVAMDTFAFISGLLIAYFCRQTVIFHQSTRKIMYAFSRLPSERV